MTQAGRHDPLTVSVEMTVRVDRATWEHLYGDAGPAAIREGVKSLALHALADSAAAAEGAILTVTRRR